MPAAPAWGPNGTELITCTDCTPGIALSPATTRALRSLACLGSNPSSAMKPSEASSTPLLMCIADRRLAIMEHALHSTAQASAISSAIRTVARRCFLSAARMGWICIKSFLVRGADSVRRPSRRTESALQRLQLQSRRDPARAECGQRARKQAHHDREHECGEKHRHVHLRQIGIRRLLMAYQPQPEQREQPAADTADEPDQSRLGQALRKHRAA